MAKIKNHAKFLFFLLSQAVMVGRYVTTYVSCVVSSKQFFVSTKCTRKSLKAREEVYSTIPSDSCETQNVPNFFNLTGFIFEEFNDNSKVFFS